MEREFWRQTQNGHIEVPEFLPPGCKIYDQPPFGQMLQNQVLFPLQYFEKAGQAGRVFWLVGKAYPLGLWTVDKDFVSAHASRDLLRIYKPTYKHAPDVIADQLNLILTLFKQYWPYAPEYIWTKWISANEFDRYGKRHVWGWGQVETYAAFAAKKAETEAVLRYRGLKDMLPTGFSTAADIFNALPAKGQSNRWFRLLFHSEALR